MKNFGAVLLAFLIVNAVLLTVARFSPPEIPVREFFVKEGWVKS